MSDEITGSDIEAVFGCPLDEDDILIGDLRAEIDQLKADIAKLETENEYLHDQLEPFRELINTKGTEIANLKNDNEQLRQCLLNVVNTSGRTRELVMAEELLAQPATPNEVE